MVKFIKRLLPKSLISRFLLILITPVIFSQLIIGIIFSEKYTGTILNIISRQMAGEAAAIAKLLDLGCEKSYIDELKKNMNLEIDILNDLKLEKSGISKNPTAYRILRNALIKKGYNNYYIDTQNQNMDIYIPALNEMDIYKISFSRKTLYMKIIPVVLGSGIISSILLLIIAFIFLKNQIRPIKKLAKAAENFGKGLDNSYEYKPEGAEEIRVAGTAFYEMRENLKNLMDNRLKVLAGISHDLRTPLTKMKLQLSVMPKTDETKWLMKDVNTMIQITENFTIHAAEQNKEKLTQINLYDFIFNITLEYISNEFSIEVTGSRNFVLLIKPVSLGRAFGNIISNAKKYSSKLVITILKKNNFVIINFEDNGPGIILDNSEELFHPFKKQNEARTQNMDDGVGLGLSIARDAILAHGGSITANNSQKFKGACFCVKLPL